MAQSRKKSQKRSHSKKSAAAKKPAVSRVKKPSLATPEIEGPVAFIQRKLGLSEDLLVSNDKLLELFSEYLAVEKGGIELYTQAAERSTDDEVKGTYEMFLEQTRQHARILTEGILDLGGDPDWMSDGAKVQEIRAESMLSLEVPYELRELADAENLLLAETKDHADWEFLAKIREYLADPNAKEVVGRMVEQVEDQEDDHLEFAKKAVEKLCRRAVFEVPLRKDSDLIEAASLKVARPAGKSAKKRKIA